MKTAITTSQLAKAILTVKGRPLDFVSYLPLELIYDVDPFTLVIRAGRQAGKSLGVAAIITIKSILRSNFTTLFISPLSQQTSRFSGMYLDPFLSSPLVRKHFTDSSSKKNVGEKSLSTKSRIYLSYAEVEADADRIRGISADAIYLDEVQDISSDALPVIYETMSASHFGFKRLTGTSKTLNNTLEYAFRASNQLFWVIRCTHCNHYNIPNDFDICLKMCAKDEGLCCAKCQGMVDTSTGTWIAARPKVEQYGFSLPQFIIPFRNERKKWLEMRQKLTSYPMGKISNEIFGLPIGIGGRILSESEALACCDPTRPRWDNCWAQDSRGIISVVIGVDWSVTASEKSFTIISVLGFDFNGKCFVLHSERVNGTDILEQVARVGQLYRQFNAQAIGSDRGVGVVQCQLLQQALGEDKVFPINYVNAKVHLRYDKNGKYFAADRTMNMDTVFIKMKIGRTKFETPAWALSANPFWMDCLSIFEEETLSGKRVFRHDEDIPDDSFHSIVFGNVAHMILAGDFTYLDDPYEDKTTY
jgi:hypothetical protein